MLMESKVDDIIILEAENRTGGRIHTIPFGDGKFIDLGAQWCHGQKKNVIYELVSPHYKFGSSKFEERDSIFRTSSKSESESDTFQEEAGELFELASDIIFDSYDKLAKFNGSLGDFVIANYKNAIEDSKYSKISDELVNLMLEFSQKFVNTFWASPSWFEISPKLDARATETGGDQDLTWKTDGYKTVFEFLNVSKIRQLNKFI